MAINKFIAATDHFQRFALGFKLKDYMQNLVATLAAVLDPLSHHWETVILWLHIRPQRTQSHPVRHSIMSLPYISDVRRSKLLSGSANCDLCKSPISILQKKAIGELYPVVPVSSCAFNVCGSYAHFNFFPYKLPLKKNVNALHLYCTDS